jgi:hypothetical protein
MGHDYVEIAGIRWATMNIGATGITDAGQYFQWGDTTGYDKAVIGSKETNYKKPFDWMDYKFFNCLDDNLEESAITKYNSSDNKTRIDLSDDGARLNWRGNWRIPTKDELARLGEAVNVTVQDNYQNSGIRCYILTDKNDSSKVLVWPRSGFLEEGSGPWNPHECYYMSSDMDSTDEYYSRIYIAHIDHNVNADWNCRHNDRPNGHVIRPVLEKGKTRPVITSEPTARTGLVYNGTLQTLLQGGSSEVPGTFDYEKQTNAGNYQALWTFYPTDTDKYYTTNGTVAASIAKVTPTVTATPTAKTGLKYTGSAQYLLSGGTASVPGSFSYSTGTAVGSYTASWTFTPTDSVNYNTVTGGGISVSIAKADGYAIVYGESYTYDGSSHSLVYVYGNTGTMHYKVGSSGSWSTSIPYATSLGTYYIYWYMNESDNYNGIASSSTRYVTSYIEDKTFPTITSSPTARTGLKYTGSAQYLLEGGSANVSGSFSYDTGTNAGTYDAYWTFNPNDTSSYYSVTGGPVSATIAKATPVITETPYSNGAIYNGNSQPLLAGGSANVSGTFSYEYATDAGTYSSAHWAFTPSDTTNYEPEYGTASGTIYKANQSAPTAYGDTATYGSTATATASGGGGYGTLTWTNGNTLSEVGYKDTAAYWSGDGNHNASPESNTVRLEVNKASRSITWASSTSDMSVGDTRALSVNISAGSSDGTLVYSSSDTSKASINGSTLTAVGVGTSVITASITGGTNYEDASTSFTLTVNDACSCGDLTVNGTLES